MENSDVQLRQKAQFVVVTLFSIGITIWGIGSFFYSSWHAYRTIVQIAFFITVALVMLIESIGRTYTKDIIVTGSAITVKNNAGKVSQYTKEAIDSIELKLVEGYRRHTVQALYFEIIFKTKDNKTFSSMPEKENLLTIVGELKKNNYPTIRNLEQSLKTRDDFSKEKKAFDRLGLYTVVVTMFVIVLALAIPILIAITK